MGDTETERTNKSKKRFKKKIGVKEEDLVLLTLLCLCGFSFVKTRNSMHSSK